MNRQLRIEKITLREIRLPLKEPFRISSGVTDTQRICLLELVSADGITEWSECVGREEPGRVGGFASSIAIHDLSAKHGIPIWCGGMLESGVGRAHNVALASLSNFKLPGDISPSDWYWERDIVLPEWTMSSEGTMSVPADKPGIGVDVDIDRVEDLTVRCQVLAQK